MRARVVQTLSQDGEGIAQKAPTAAAIAETTTPKPRTGLGPNLSVSRPDNGAPMPENRPRMITK